MIEKPPHIKEDELNRKISFKEIALIISLTHDESRVFIG